MNEVPSLVTDASVVVKWLIREEYSVHAQRLLADCIMKQRVIAVPPHFHAEVLNVLVQRQRRTDPDVQISAADATTALRRFLILKLEAVAPDDLYDGAFRFVQTHGLRSIYDALYVALAQMLGCELWTADRRLLAALGAAAPWMRFIGDYQGAT